MSDDQTPIEPFAEKLHELAERPVPERTTRLERRDLERDVAGSKLRRNAIIIVVVVTLLASFGTWRAETASDKATAAAERAAATATQIVVESIDRQVTQCQSSNEFRRLFRGYLAKQSTGISVDQVVELPGFDDLPPGTQQFVRTLAEFAQLSAANARKVREEYVNKFPTQDCVKLRRTLTAKAHRPAKPLVAPKYTSCKDAKADGVTPLRIGDPSYNTKLDSDHDGLACE